MRNEFALSRGDCDPSSANFDPDWHPVAEAKPLPAQPVAHPAFTRMMQRLPLHIRQSLPPEALVALSQASLPKDSPHAVNYRVSVPFFGKRYYLTVLAGRERRSMERLLAEQQLHMRRVAMAYAMGGSLILTIVFFVSILALYAIKSASGIDLFPEHSTLHDIVEQMDNWYNS